MGELRVFVAVLEHRSFRKAATALCVTQPAVTKAVAGLEDMLGVKLFDRAANGVEPTIHGVTFAPHAIAIFDELRTAAQELSIVSRGAKGTLRIGALSMPALGFLPKAVGRLIDTHPDIFITMVEGRDGDLCDRLRRREIEVAVLRIALFNPGPDMKVTPLFEERLCVLASRDHPLASRKRLAWSDVIGQRWVMPPADSYFFDHIRRMLLSNHLSLPRHVVESLSIHVQYAMVLHGGMLSFGLRSRIAITPGKDLLVQLPIELPAFSGTVAAVTLRERQTDPLAEQLIQHIRAMAEEQPAVSTPIRLRAGS